MPGRLASLPLILAALASVVAVGPSAPGISASSPRTGVSCASTGAGRSDEASQDAHATSARDLRLVAEYRYSLSAEAWILLIRKDSIGGARLRQHVGADGLVAWEVVGGTDPARAPLRFNYWLYVRELVEPSGTTVLTVTRDTDHRTVEEAKARGGREPRGTTTGCKAIRSTVNGLNASTTEDKLTVARGLTFRDVNELTALFAELPASTSTPRRTSLPVGTSGGLPTALYGLMSDTVAWHQAGQPQGSQPYGRPRPYIHEGKLYDLVLERSQVRPRATIPGVGPTDLIKGRFAIRKRSDGQRIAFDVEFGASGPLMCVPVRFVARPRWWLKVSLVLDAVN